MSPENNLSPGFSTIDEAVALIKSDSRDNPVVDMDYIVSKTVWIETNHNFRIPKIRMLTAEEYAKAMKRPHRGPVKDYEVIGNMYVYIATNFEKELLKKTILDKYRELVGRDYQEAGLRSTSTVADDAQGKDAVRPRANKPIAKEGAYIGGGETMTSNGDGLLV